MHLVGFILKKSVTVHGHTNVKHNYFGRRKNQQMTKVHMFIHNRLTQHVSGIIMPIVRRTDCIKPRVMLAWMCWLWFCGVGTRAERTV